MDDLLGEAAIYIFGPIVLVVLVFFGVSSLLGGCSEKKPVPIERVEEKKSLTYRAGQKTKEASKDFVRGFLAK